jgi:hypothetical protein
MAVPPKRIKEMFSPSPRAKKIVGETLRSPAADTLWQISGGGKPTTFSNLVATVLLRARNGLAGYNPIFDNVIMDPSQESLNKNPEESMGVALNALSHEAGHRADFRRSNPPGRNAPFRLPEIDLPPAPPRSPTTGKLVQVSPKEWRVQEQKSNDPFERQRSLVNAARSKVDAYYQSSPREGYAQAFASAMDVLRNTPQFFEKGKSRDDYAQELAKVEAETPGAGGIVEELLKEPVFKNHPLQRIYKRKP